MQRTEEITAKALARVGQDRYKLVMLVSKRADQLANGAEPLVKADKNKQKFTDIALLEISEGKIRLESITDL
ncbi:MAG: DNA-directed RNA polymerase subunit omega [Sulfurospirillum sp.]|jgi:DNA-directed RNA polymerase subunit omega|uniref:DNA-directed RNA polymerase subunit omega n=1 Tax=Sulfurospirillum sp. UCH001 TaxID=1581011 RepID=UPI00083776F9|nr:MULTISPECIES: DNA-directed RNA polymerase subunit omega [unclassified Sulfurospirillum]WNY98336.1 DNA-directed RNA polymerase subunit omega [Sulfurospirillum sp. 'SP']